VVVNKQLNKILGFFLEILMVVMVLVVILQILARYAIKVSIPWTEESARYMLAFMTFIGAAIALREGKHIVVDFLYARFPPGLRKGMDLFFHVLIILFLAGILKGGLTLIGGAWDVPTASITWITMGQVYLILPLGLVIMIWFELCNLWELLRRKKGMS
jgi:TRAP-type transport system small permease protein